MLQGCDDDDMIQPISDYKILCLLDVRIAVKIMRSHSRREIPPRFIVAKIVDANKGTRIVSNFLQDIRVAFFMV